MWDRPQVLVAIADLLTVGAVAALGLAGVVWLARLPIFPLREMVLTSEPARVTRAQLEYAVRLGADGNFFTVSLDRVRAALERLPWVRRAEVRRVWPGRLEISLQEHSARARWRDPGTESLLVNREGEVFAAAYENSLPLFTGPEGTSALMLKRYDEFSSILRAKGRSIRRLDLSTRQAWRMELDDGLNIDLGRDQSKAPLAERLTRFAAVREQVVEKLGPGIAYVDLRYPNGFAARVAGGAAVRNKEK
ncbi:MAG: cell division protein FtsQ/DivIB [Rhodocyclaceae bacterium]|nr:cell division protein FtsQ/DivIB [Rhodocyclaceae bacterium]MBX3670194.1 cell division protein FtsQ/DivIB [Rhodocyclaceae bacterium]